ELLAYLENMLDEDYPPERARDDALFYAAFDFMPPETDLRQVQLDVLAEQIGGFYDPEIEAMFVISAQAELSAMNQILYAHEFTHALQDQYFDLETLVDEELEVAHPDAALAALALVEGDAMLMTEGYQTWLMDSNPGAVFGMLGDALVMQTQALMGAPAILRTELMFPYSEGRAFAYAIFAESGSWEGVNAAYANPPQTTEQVLHPEAYFSAEAPVEVVLPALDALLAEGWRLVWDRTLGELYLREHLRQTLTRDVADAAAEGWGGDRYHLYAAPDGSASVLVWRTTWDTPADAAEFAAAYQNYGSRVYDAPGYPLDESTVCWYGPDARCLRAGTDETLVIRGPEEALVADALVALSPVR
ncbi:MAG: hypothetical protein JXN59_12745, partial [Anaerolineae bacterium]|nr:hypothetical protein [Anaerolineae bacterium]